MQLLPQGKTFPQPATVAHCARLVVRASSFQVLY